MNSTEGKIILKKLEFDCLYGEIDYGHNLNYSILPAQDLAQQVFLPVIAACGTD